MNTSKFLSILSLTIGSFFVSCEHPVELTPAPTSGLIDITAQFADESISSVQFTTSQMHPFGDTIRIEFPEFFPSDSNNPIDITNMRMKATLPVNVMIRPNLTVMDLTKPNTIEVINSDGTIDKHVIIGVTK